MLGLQSHHHGETIDMLCDPGAHYLMSLCLSLIIYKKGHKMESAKELCEVIYY